jgi:hypothetical protein
MIFEAGMVTFLRTILIIVLVYYGIKFLFKILIPIILNRFMKRQQDKFQQAQSHNSTQKNPSKEEKKSTERKDTLGEYVDYEDVE